MVKLGESGSRVVSRSPDLRHVHVQVGGSCTFLFFFSEEVIWRLSRKTKDKGFIVFLEVDKINCWKKSYRQRAVVIVQQEWDWIFNLLYASLKRSVWYQDYVGSGTPCPLYPRDWGVPKMLIRGTMDGHTLLAETAASASLLVKNANDDQPAVVLNQFPGYP